MFSSSHPNALLSSPSAYLLRIISFLIIVATVVVFLGLPSDRLRFFFNANSALNGVILSVLLIGIIYACHRMLMLWREINWVNALGQGTATTRTMPPPKLLAPLAAMMNRSVGPLVFTQTSLGSVMDSVSTRLDETREILRYLIGLLIFLGLLGTFWGLLVTISSISDLIATLGQSRADDSAIFTSLIAGLQAPLGGMGTAFSSSLFGLAGSLVLGFLDLQLGQAQNRFVIELEDWLSTSARFAQDGVTALPKDDLSDVAESLSQLLERLRGRR